MKKQTTQTQPRKTNLLYVRQDIGEGDPIVLLHGMFADGSQWEKISQLLSKNFRVIVVDLLGHGRSPRPANATYSYKEHVVALDRTLKSIGATKNITVVGYSMGGAVALAYSSTYPTSVSQLYLISTPFYLEPEQMLPNKYAGSILFAKTSTNLFSIVERLTKSSPVFHSIIKFGNTSSKFHAMIGANDNQLDAKIIRQNLNQLVHKFNFVRHLSKLQSPLTIYSGKKDVFIAQSQLDALKQFHKNIDIQRLNVIKIDHMLVQNLPKEIARLLNKNTRQLLNVPIDKGNGKVLILIHGIESSGNYWSQLIEPLTESYRVVAIDLLGFGDSPKPLNIAYSLDDQIEALERTLNAHNINKFEIAAHSYGCMVALGFAAKHNKRVKSIRLFSPVFIPDKSNGSKQMIGQLDFIDKIDNGGVVKSRAVQALGYKHTSEYIPFVRTVQNAIRKQNVSKIIKQTSKIPIQVIYGKKDKLIDEQYLLDLCRPANNIEITSIKSGAHNYILFDPSNALKYGFPNNKFKTVPKKSNIVSPSLARQLVIMAVPIMIGKSLLYLTAGILLLTRFATWVITFGLAASVMKLGFDYIRGSFSLKNENLSYVGYILLGGFGILIGFSLIRNPNIALRVSSLAICGLVLLAGLARLTVATFWVKRRKPRRNLIVTGSLMSLIGLLALFGGIYSTKIIVYSLAVILIVRGIQFAIFSATAIIFSYIRGFNKKI